MREVVTLALDILGLLLVAAGLASLVFLWLGWGCLAVAGLVILGGSLLADWLSRKADG